jgi:alpha 1,6-mannosyltransferase
LKKADRDRIEAGEAWQDVLGEASVVIGIEADVGGREDWHEWWPRPVSILLLYHYSNNYHRTSLTFRSK